MTEDLFAWADRSERNAARREARRQRKARMGFLAKHRGGSIPDGGASIVDFETERWNRIDRLLDSTLAAYHRGLGRAAGLIPAAPILPFDGVRRQA